MNEFDITEEMSEEDFAKMMEESLKKSDSFSIGDKVEGIIVKINNDTAFVDISGRSDAVVSTAELTDQNGNLTVKEGDRITAYISDMRRGETVLTVKIGHGAGAKEMLAMAYENGIPVEGHVSEEVKGGFSVMISESRCFCPLSQIDMRPASDHSIYLNRDFLFKITKYAERGRNIILSRRDLLEAEKQEKEAQLKETLHKGDTVTGTVASVQEFGIFVDLGGVQGLVPRSELSWGRNASPSDYEAGTEIQVLVSEISWETNRISLSIKRLQPEPWTFIDRFPEGSTAAGTVTNIIKSGAFVELRPGLEGFIHVSRMSCTKRITKPEDAVSKGSTVTVRIAGINAQEKKISLELVTGENDPWQTPAESLLNTIQTGTVEDSKASGAHIRLSSGLPGFAPKEKLADKGTDIQKEFPAGKEVKVLVTEFDPENRKLILSVKDALIKQERDEYMEFGSGAAAKTGTSLGAIFKDKFADLQKKIENR